MTSLQSRLAKVLQFNPRKFSNEWVIKGVGMPMPHGANSGAQVENNRLSELHKCLVEMITSIEHYAKYVEQINGFRNNGLNKYLDKLESVVSRMEGE